MRCSLAWSAGSATTPVCSLFFLLRALEVRMCRANACCLTTFPVPVFLNRLDAPLWVLSLGMKYSGKPKFYHNAAPARLRPRHMARNITGVDTMVEEMQSLVGGSQSAGEEQT